MKRRTFLGAMVATAAGLLVPERDPKRVYSFPKRIQVLEPGYYLALHTEDPGALGASESRYPGYAPQALERTPEGWRVRGASAENLKPIQFPMCIGGHETVTHWSVRDHMGRQLLISPVRPNPLEGFAVQSGIVPIFAPGELRVTLS